MKLGFSIFIGTLATAFVLAIALVTAPWQVRINTPFVETRWRAVQLSPGVFSVARCTDDGVCAKNGAGTTGYRFSDVELAKQTALGLEQIRTQGDLNPVLVP